MTERRISELLSVLSELNEVGNKIIDHIPEKTYAITDRYILLWNERFVHSLTSLEPLLQLYQKKKRVSIGVSIILRSALLDVLNWHYMNYHIKEKFPNRENPEITQAFNSIFGKFESDQIDFQLKQIEHFRQLELITEEEEVMYCTSIFSEYSRLFTEIPVSYTSKDMKAKIRYTGNHPGAWKITQELSSKQDNQHQKVSIGRIYEKYCLYSKVEHFGAFSYHVTRINKDSVSMNILESVAYITDAFKSSSRFLEKLHPDISLLRRSLDNISKRLLEIE